MIDPLPHFSKPDFPFVVTDIENRPDGEVISIDTAWREPDNIEHHTILHDRLYGFSCCWDAYFSWLYKRALGDNRFRTVYAHNGGGWDWLSLAEYLLNDGRKRRKSLTCICANSNMIVLRVTISKRCTIVFCDSLQLLRSSLDRLSKVYGLSGKVEFPYDSHETLFERDRRLFMRYIRADTENLLIVMEKSLALIREHVAPVRRLGYTIGSTAMLVFRTKGLDREISIPWDAETKDFLRSGYRGGRVECFRSGVYDHICVYDINSLYPKVMAKTKVPISDRGIWLTDYRPGKCGVWRIRFRQENRDIPPVFIVGGNGKYEGEGVYFSPEIDLFRSADPNGTLDVKRGYVFSDTDYIFTGWVHALYDLRRKHKGDPVDLLCKYLLNSLYGKFGQNPVREKIAAITAESCDSPFVELSRLINAGASVRALNEELGIYGLTEETTCLHEHVGIAGTITSAARVKLYDGLLRAGKGLVYCDTDSVHTTGCLDDDLIGDDLGMFKKEFEGEGVYCGKKLYALRDQNKSEKIRIKGVSIGGRNGARISFDNLVGLLDQGQTIITEFTRPGTAMDIFTGKKRACVFEPKKRTIKRTA